MTSQVVPLTWPVEHLPVKGSGPSMTVLNTEIQKLGGELVTVANLVTKNRLTEVIVKGLFPPFLEGGTYHNLTKTVLLVVIK